MITAIIPKLPMRNKAITSNFYVRLGFETSENDYDGYLMVKMNGLEIHFFEFRDLIPGENYGQIYIRSSDIEMLYQYCIENNIKIHPAGNLNKKSWGQTEFSVLDPDHNLITFGQASE